eukprot:TRINITY_DN20283_c0_g1_i1.p2 TRINITY_DN20283_c0_g1~~TRINITY_DN20283_c0_g1_i1.p2  ORF type:complete len:132 (+),score=22.55 TRINITY_DN20283_c0_g1_i1:180-575(+)
MEYRDGGLDGVSQRSRGADQPGHYINLSVVGQDGKQVYFRMRAGQSLRKLMIAYCTRELLDVRLTEFWFGGQRLRPEQTPLELEMEDGDEIDALPPLMEPISTLALACCVVVCSAVVVVGVALLYTRRQQR